LPQSAHPVKTSHVLLIVLNILATLALVGLNAFFVAAEFAAVSTRASHLQTSEAITLRHRAALQVKSRLDLYLAGCQFGNTLASLALGAITEPVVAALITPAMAALHLSYHSQHVLAFVLSFSLAVSLHIVVGEQAPKYFAIVHADRLLTALAIPLILFTWLFYPGIWLLNAATHLVLRGSRVDVSGRHLGTPHNEQELRALLLQAAASGTITVGKANLLENAFEFGSLKVRQIMTPRPEVDFLLVDQPISELLQTEQQSAFTRLPLCDGDLDHVIGLIHMKDLFNHLHLTPGKLKFIDEKTPEGEAIAIPTGLPGSAVHVIGSGDLDLRKVKRDVMFVPELMPISRLLRQFQTRRQHLAIVVDEYGSTQGIVTMEDVLEEIVGQIDDEFDPMTPSDLVKVGDSVRVSGLYPLHELRDRLPIGPVEAENVDTIGGYITQQLKRWPRTGDSVDFGGYRAEVLSLQQRRVGQVLISPPKKPAVENR
jgi:CBS domain containing-hemolysin-like protein